MSYQNPFKEVDYFQYCHRCVHEEKTENEDPCWDCLTSPVNAHSRKPINFIEKEKTNENRKAELQSSDKN